MVNRLEDARRRASVIAERVRQRTDLELRGIIENFDEELTFVPLEQLAISQLAWDYVVESSFDTKLVFAHPALLSQYPRTSEYYRGIALLSRKRVSEIAVSVDSWESGARTTVGERQSVNVARLYNAVISSIIEGATGWTLENGYRKHHRQYGNRTGRHGSQPDWPGCGTVGERANHRMVGSSAVNPSA